MKIQDVPNFILPEFVPKSIWDRYRNHSTRFIDQRLPIIEQATKKRFGMRTVTINNWYWHKPHSNFTRLEERGDRLPFTKTGAAKSAHKRGMAIDDSINGITPQEAQLDVIKNWENFYKPLGVTVLEYGTPSWTHKAVEWTNSDELWVIDATEFYGTYDSFPDLSDLKNSYPIRIIKLRPKRSESQLKGV